VFASQVNLTFLRMVSIYIQKNKHQYDFAVLLLHMSLLLELTRCLNHVEPPTVDRISEHSKLYP